MVTLMVNYDGDVTDVKGYVIVVVQWWWWWWLCVRGEVFVIVVWCGVVLVLVEGGGGGVVWVECGGGVRFMDEEKLTSTIKVTRLLMHCGRRCRM